MTYTVYDYIEEWTRKFSDWWELIEYLDGNINCIAHNKNDLFIYYECGKFKRKPNDLTYEEEIIEKAKNLLVGKKEYIPQPTPKVYYRDLFVYDENKTIVNLAEIRDAVAVLKPRVRKETWYPYSKRPHFVYRQDPVPFISAKSKRWGRGYRKVNMNKSYVAKVSEYVDLFPNDASIRRAAFFSNKWDDYYYYRHTDSSWKSQSKKKKQWM